MHLTNEIYCRPTSDALIKSTVDSKLWCTVYKKKSTEVTNFWCAYEMKFSVDLNLRCTSLMKSTEDNDFRCT